MSETWIRPEERSLSSDAVKVTEPYTGASPARAALNAARAVPCVPTIDANCGE